MYGQAGELQSTTRCAPNAEPMPLAVCTKGPGDGHTAGAVFCLRIFESRGMGFALHVYDELCILRL